VSAPGRPKDHAARLAAATDLTTNLVVSAGAGTGKTSLLVERMLTAIGSGHAPLPSIAAITFTDKAAGELRHRLATGLAELHALAAGEHRAPTTPAAANAFAWLTESGVPAPAVASRVAEAEGSLDRASVTTIHGLCSEILRAHPLAAGLPPGFVADKGLAGRRLAAQEWTAFVESELGAPGPRTGLWERLLAALTLTEIEEIARALAGGALSRAALSGEHRIVDLRAAVGERARKLADEIGEALAQRGGVTPAPTEWLTEAERVLTVFATQGAAAARAAIEVCSRVPDAMPDVRTKSVKPADAAALKAIERRARPLLRGLASWDERLEADLFAALLPFARALRTRQERAGIVDFDGLLVRARDLLRDDPKLRAGWKRRFEMILVDEFQDTDPIQYEIVFFLAEREGEAATDAYATKLAPGRLFIVGDAKQSIYRFRGADYAAYRRAVSHVLAQGGAELSLRSNFRSIPAVLHPINALFAPTGTAWTASEYLPPYDAIDPERSDAVEAAVEIWTTAASSGSARDRRRAESQALAAELSTLTAPPGSFRFDDILLLFRGFTDLAPYLRAMRDASIPFVVSGGRTFFERTEITQAMAVLRAVADPEDPIALLAYRRSPAGGVPDTELFGDAPSVALAAADLRLSRLRAAAAAMPVDAAVRHVLEASGLITLSGLAFEASQRVANLEKLALAASDLARDGRRTLLATLDALEDGFESDEEGDSPLADAERDAVRVMSIHRAKGLEARVVILADTAADRRASRATKASTRMVRTDAGEFVRLTAPRFANSASIVSTIDDTLHEEAEDIRLLYVALTRARDRLIVFGGGVRKTPWNDALASWQSGVTRRVVSASSAAGRPAASAEIGAPAAATRYDAAAAAVSALAVPRFRGPSGADDDERAFSVPGALPRELARDIGRMVHARLAGLAGPGGTDASAEVDRLLALLAQSPLAARLASAQVLGREVPMLLEEDGARWQGSIDLLFRDADDTIVVADFKTDASDDGAAARHSEQLRIYTRAVRRAMPGRTVRAELWMLRTGRVIEV
jgi:ATP-dependent helicase/nuclease subunit A